MAGLLEEAARLAATTGTAAAGCPDCRRVFALAGSATP
jgi:hypothetical protein